MGFHKRLLIDQQERERLLKYQRAPRQEKSRGADKMAAANDKTVPLNDEMRDHLENYNREDVADTLRTKGEACE
jgi:hypothetical protein